MNHPTEVTPVDHPSEVTPVNHPTEVTPVNHPTEGCPTELIQDHPAEVSIGHADAVNSENISPDISQDSPPIEVIQIGPHAYPSHRPAKSNQVIHPNYPNHRPPKSNQVIHPTYEIHPQSRAVETTPFRKLIREMPGMHIMLGTMSRRPAVIR